MIQTQASDDRRAILTRINNNSSSSSSGTSGMGHAMGHSSSVSLHRGRDSIGGGAAAGMNGMNSGPSVHSVVPDDALFPPPMPMTGSRGMMTGQGSSGGNGFNAGVGGTGTKQQQQQVWMNRDRSDSGSSQRDPFRNPADVVTPPLKDTPLPSIQHQQQQPRPAQQQQQPQRQQHPASRDSIAAIAGLPLSLPPPTALTQLVGVLHGHAT